jgi:beta-glucosidase-like glycosyl hydrolase/CubicO group peptidase (beta-lactamase class C family)
MMNRKVSDQFSYLWRFIAAMQFSKKNMVLCAGFFMLLFPLASFSQLVHGNTPEADRWADSVYQSLSLSEKIAQLIFVRANYSGEDYIKEIPALIEKYNIGGVTFFAGDPVKQVQKTNEWNALARTPLFISIDAEWGLGMRLKGTLKYPLQMTLGAISDDQLVYRMGRQIGQQCRRMGIHINFAPVVDVNSNPRNPVIGMRSFGEDPGRVSVLATQYMKGLQDEGVIASAKHFPGHGDSGTDSHYTLPVLNRSKKEMRNVELVPFEYLIGQGVASIMVAHLAVPAFDKNKKRPASLSAKLIDKQLKQKMGYDALIITDGLDMKGVTNYYPEGDIALQAFKAGNDVLLIPDNIPASIRTIENAIVSGKADMERLEESCKKILRYKYLTGASKRKAIDTSNLLTDLNQHTFIITADTLFSKAITVVKNKEDLLPLDFPDTLNPVVVIIGSEDEQPFEGPFQQFIPTRVLRLKHDATVAERQRVISSIGESNLVIIALVNTNILASRRFGITESNVQFIEFIARIKPVIIDIFASPYSLDLFASTDIFKSIVVSYQDNTHMQHASAEVILGMHASGGQLPVSAGGFASGTGISTAKTRLTYASPEDLMVSKEYLKKVDSLLTDAISIGAFPGCQVLAAKDGYIFYHKAFGFHTYDSTRALEMNDMYDLASLTKILATTPALMAMVDKGILDIDKNLSDYLFYLKGTNKEDLGFREVLTHQSGLTPWIPYYERTLINNRWDTLVYRPVLSEDYPVRVAENMYINEYYKYQLIDEIVQSELGEKEYAYSDLGFYLFKEMIEDMTNMSFENYLTAYFYKPMGLGHLRFKPRKHFPISTIVPTEFDQTFRNQLLVGDVHDQGAAMLGGVSGHAGLFGNAYDVAVIMQMFLNGGVYGGRHFISSATIEEFTSVQFPENDNRRGLGFDKPLLEYEDHRSSCKDASPSSFGHSGFTGTYTWADPETGLVYVFLSNRVYPDMTNGKISKLDIRTNVHQLFYEAIKNK